MKISSFSDDILLRIFVNLDPVEVVKLRPVCVKWNGLATSISCWTDQANKLKLPENQQLHPFLRVMQASQHLFLTQVMEDISETTNKVETIPANFLFSHHLSNFLLSLDKENLFPSKPHKWQLLVDNLDKLEAAIIQISKSTLGRVHLTVHYISATKPKIPVIMEFNKAEGKVDRHIYLFANDEADLADSSCEISEITDYEVIIDESDKAVKKHIRSMLKIMLTEQPPKKNRSKYPDSLISNSASEA